MQGCTRLISRQWTTHQYCNVHSDIEGQRPIPMHEEVVCPEEHLQVLWMVPHQLNEVGHTKVCQEGILEEG